MGLGLAPVATITVVTATLNCEIALERLVRSLLLQDDQSFDWIVIDGCSIDNTESVARKFPAERLTFIVERDFGVYDALNKGVRRVKTDYYLVVGADDELLPSAIRNFSAASHAASVDLVAAGVATEKKLLVPMAGDRWRRGGNAYVASHAVGTLIRTNLHDRVGYYSNRYPNCADMFFVLSAVDVGKARIVKGNFVAGSFGTGGMSSSDRLCSICDAFRVQLAFGGNRWIQVVLFTLRVVRSLLTESKKRLDQRDSV